MSMPREHIADADGRWAPFGHPAKENAGSGANSLILRKLGTSGSYTVLERLSRDKTETLVRVPFGERTRPFSNLFESRSLLRTEPLRLGPEGEKDSQLALVGL